MDIAIDPTIIPAHRTFYAFQVEFQANFQGYTDRIL